MARRCLPIVVVSLASCATGPTIGSIDQASTVCATGSTVNGLDVSYYDDAVDWPTAKAAGIDFAFIRVTDGTQYQDPKFAAYWAGARAAGVIRGAYQYFRPSEDPIAQADLLLQLMGPLLPGDLPPVLDLEVSGGLTPAEVTTNVQAWIAHITAAIGRPPIVYAGLYSWPTLTDGADVTTSPLWIAQYTTAACPDIPDPWTQWLFWQDSDTGVVDGVTSSQLDLDVFNGTLADLQAFTVGGAVAPCGVIADGGGTIDDSDPCFTPGGPSAFMRHVTGAGNDGDLYWTHTTDAATEANYGLWTLDFATAGTYLVETYTAAAYATSKQATYVIQASGTQQTVTIDQTAVDGWQSLGDIAFAAGGSQSINLGDNTGETAQEQVVFDAVRFTPLDRAGSGSDTPPNPSPPSTQTAGCSTAGGGGFAVILALGFVRRRRHLSRI